MKRKRKDVMKSAATAAPRRVFGAVMQLAASVASTTAKNVQNNVET